MNSNPIPSSRGVGPTINLITIVGPIKIDINKPKSIHIMKVDTRAPRYDVEQQKQFFVTFQFQPHL